MPKLADLLAQRDALDHQIAELRKQEVADVISTIQKLVHEYGLTCNDIFATPVKKTGRSKVAAKYRDPVSGKTWTGRGKAPQWIAGKNRDQYVIVY